MYIHRDVTCHQRGMKTQWVTYSCQDARHLVDDPNSLFGQGEKATRLYLPPSHLQFPFYTYYPTLTGPCPARDLADSTGRGQTGTSPQQHNQHPTTNNVINLSSHHLSNDELELLGLGLSFVQSPHLGGFPWTSLKPTLSPSATHTCPDTLAAFQKPPDKRWDLLVHRGGTW